jgi:hypothetical protein
MCRVLNKHDAGHAGGRGLHRTGLEVGQSVPDRCRRRPRRRHREAPLWLADQHDLLRALDELRGRDLVCFCAPLPCHGDLLLRLANESREERIAWWRATTAAA